MATNKHATIRYRTLDRCFSSGRRYYLKDLIEACNKALYDYTGTSEGVKRRQIYDDITFMESEQGWNIPLERVYDGHKKYFRYSDRSFSINKQPVNESEAAQLKEALLTLSRFRGMPKFEWLDELVTRLDSGLGLSQSKRKIIEFEQNSYLKGLDYISPIYDAILNYKFLEISYQSFKQEKPHSILFQPYFLKQYNNRWFVFGKRDDLDEIHNLALDRIHDIHESNRIFAIESVPDFEEYFEDIIGVTLHKQDKPIKVELRVSPSRFPYIQTKPLHGSQKEIKSNENECFISLDLIANKELESLLLSFGDDIEVLKPTNLRVQITRKISLMKNLYTHTSIDQLHD